MRLSLRTICFPLIAMCHGALAQEALPKFEVASIKVNREAFQPWHQPLPGGKLDFTGVTLKDLIAGAWGINPDEVLGGPGWVDSIRYNVLAKAEAGATQGMSFDQILHYDGLMMRSLLIERFHVAVHFETREAPIYALVIARRDGKLGPGLKEPKDGGCEELELKPFVLPEKGKFPALMCGQGLINLNGTARAAQVELKQLAETLSRDVGRPVVDETGLKQKFDIDIQWTRRPSRSGWVDPSFFSDIEEQLGLKLVSRKGPVDFLVIDHAEQASEN